ncbi:MAG TPA: PilZ domain-containing protein [Thermoanaerobaculia bacterium]|nr:PilZ domain-containing protein [Thermoanaerobaculia bacterium]
MQELRPEERREFQRLNLNPPIAATLGSHSVRICEIGVLGARVEHDDELGSDMLDLRFKYAGEQIAMRCQVVRTAGRSESGVRFIAAVGDSGDKLRDMLGILVTKEIDRRRTAPGRDPLPSHAVDGDKTVRGNDAAFLTYRFEKGHWTKRPVFLPEQPSTGFTVARVSDSDEMQRLCRVYEASDEEGRRLIRLFAELSVSDALAIPPPVES